MKLFMVTYTVGLAHDLISESYLTTGDNEEDVLERETKILEEKHWCVNVYLTEINVVDGYKINLEKCN